MENYKIYIYEKNRLIWTLNLIDNDLEKFQEQLKDFGWTYDPIKNNWNICNDLYLEII